MRTVFILKKLKTLKKLIDENKGKVSLKEMKKINEVFYINRRKLEGYQDIIQEIEPEWN
jgi:hypothetical protein